MSDWTSIGANIAMMLGPAGGAVAWLYTSVIKPNREALERANLKLDELDKAGIAEKLLDYAGRLKKVEDAHLDCHMNKLPQLVSHADLQRSTVDRDVRLAEIRKEVADGREDDRKGRKALHEELAIVRREMATVSANTNNLEGWLEKLDDRFDTKTTELVAAVAKAAGRQER